MNSLGIFCRQVRSRSAEHRQAIHLLYSAGLYAPIVSILRQELDSMIRSIYLLSIEDRATRNQLIEASINGKDWRLTIANGKQKKVTDRDMVELANQLQGWTESVYRFGCGFIHLSNLHDHHARDPMSLIPASEKAVILQHMRHYHGGPLQPDPTFLDLQPFLPMVFDKIAGNLVVYLNELEEGKMIDDNMRNDTIKSNPTSRRNRKRA